MTGYRTVFPDIHFAIEQEVAAGDKVVSHWRCRGTHRAELMGIPATGKTIDVEGISILHLDHGKITHQTTIWDALNDVATRCFAGKSARRHVESRRVMLITESGIRLEHDHCDRRHTIASTKINRRP